MGQRVMFLTDVSIPKLYLTHLSIFGAADVHRSFATTLSTQEPDTENWIMTTSHEPAYPQDGMPKERYTAYHAERAKAGVALAMTAGSAVVSKDSPPVFNNILVYRDDVVPWIPNLTDAVHDHGCAVMIQLTHLGRRTTWNKGDWLPSVSSSGHRETAHRAFPKRIEDWDIDRIIADFADAAERMKSGGIDGIELQVYGRSLDQFWSPLSNDLVGPYGADTLENRMRFPMDVVSAIRKRVGADFIVGLRYTAVEAQKGGILAEEGLDISKRLAATGQVDFLNVIRGRIHTDPAMTDMVPVQGMKSAPHLDFAGRVKAATGMPTFHAARIPDVATPRHAFQPGLLDMVGMTRVHMADLHIVQKITDGHENDIRPCVGATYCLDRIYQAGEALCIHNPATGRELTMPHQIAPATTSKNVVFEAASDHGGQIRLTTQNSRRREMIGILDWRMAQCGARDVRFHLNTLTESDDVTALNPDVVIIATGGQPNTELFEQNGEHAHVVSCWDIIAGGIKPVRRVLVYAESGDHPALQAAEVAAEAGAHVEVMTPDRTFARFHGDDSGALYAQFAGEKYHLHRHLAVVGGHPKRQHADSTYRHGLQRSGSGKRRGSSGDELRDRAAGRPVFRSETPVVKRTGRGP